MLYTTTLTARRLEWTAFLRTALIAGAVAFVALLAGALLYLGRPDLALALVIAPTGLLLLGRWPAAGFYAVVMLALVFDHYTTPGVTLLTTTVPVFESVDGITGIPLPLTPVEIIALMSLALLVLQRMHAGRRPLLAIGRLALPVALFTGALGYGLWRGITFHDLQNPLAFNADAAIAEMSPFIFLPVMYLLAVNVLDSQRRVTTFAWVIIVSLGVKSLQGAWVVASLGGGVLDLNEIATHEDSLFANCLILLAIGLWALDGPRTQRLATIIALPLVVLMLAANQRRAAYVALALGLMIVVSLLLTIRRRRRHVLVATALFTIVAAAYTAAFWNSDSLAAVPVYSFRAISDPGAKDVDSNIWRDMENLNIESTIERAPLTGIGFGRRYLFRIEQPSIDFSGFIYWRYFPHNQIYWLWIKLGAIGFAAFWYMIGAGLILGTLAFRRLEDSGARALVLMATGMLAMQVVFSYADLGLAVSRNMAYLGALLGLIAALHRGTTPADEPVTARPRAEHAALPPRRRAWKR